MTTTRTRIISAAVAATLGAVAFGVAPANAASVSELPQLKQGAKGAYVLALQAELYRVGYNLKGTGYFGSETKRAVVSWQKANHIKASGIVGPKTWNSLSGCGVPSATYLKTQYLTPGQKIDGVQQWFLTQDLGWVEFYFPTWADLPEPSNNWPTRYDDRYVRVVKELQKRAGIKASGIVGPQTTRVVSLLSSTQDRCVG